MISKTLSIIFKIKCLCEIACLVHLIMYANFGTAVQGTGQGKQGHYKRHMTIFMQQITNVHWVCTFRRCEEILIIILGTAYVAGEGVEGKNANNKFPNFAQSQCSRIIHLFGNLMSLKVNVKVNVKLYLCFSTMP
jgi:hypothetical protein